MTDNEMNAYTEVAGKIQPPHVKRQSDANPEPGPVPTDVLTYKVGDKVLCKCGEWTTGEVVAFWFRDDWWDTGRYAPYQVKLESGGLIYVPHDKSAYIRPAPAK